MPIPTPTPSGWGEDAPRRETRSTGEGEDGGDRDGIQTVSFQQILEEFAEVVDEGVEIGFGGVPGAHEAAAGVAFEDVEMPAAGMELLDGVEGELDEDAVGLDGVKELEAGEGFEEMGELPGHGIGMGGVAEPGAVGEQSAPGSGEEAHFGGQLAGLFDAVLKVAGEVGVEEHNGFGDGPAVFGEAEAEDVDAGAPGEVGGGDVEVGEGVGETGAVEVDMEAEAVGGAGEVGEVVGGIDGAEFGGLGEAEGGGFGGVEGEMVEDGLFDGGGMEQAVVTGEGEETGAAAKELGGGAFVVLDMGGGVAEDGVVGAMEVGEGEGIGAGAVEDQEHLGVGFQEIADGLAGVIGPGIGTVGGGVVLIGVADGLPGFGTDGSLVVAGEMAGTEGGC